jgi:flagellar protein FliS
MNNPYLQSSNKYKDIDLQSRIDTASPHELIMLLIQGARTHVAIAQGNIQRKEIKEKGEHIGKALSIIDGLKVSLNMKEGGDIATNLHKLYVYLEKLLLKANLHNDEKFIIEANSILTTIHEAWQGIQQ